MSEPIALVVGAVVIVIAWIGGWAGWVHGRARRGQGGVGPTWYPPMPPQWERARDGAPGEPT